MDESGTGEHLHRVGTELHGSKSVQSSRRHGHHQRQDKDWGVGASEATECAEVASSNHGRDFIHFAGLTKNN